VVPVSGGMGGVTIAVLIMFFFATFLHVCMCFLSFLFVIASVFYMGDESGIVAAVADLLSYMVFLHCIVILAHN
jgi:hypothetical protein